MQLYSGANYEIVAEGAIAVCRVWRRPDLDLDEGARCATEKIAHFRHLAAGSAAGMLFDLSLAPPVTGPKTQQAIGDMLAAFEAASKPIAVVAGSAMAHLQLRRLQHTFARSAGRLFVDIDSARAWLRASTSAAANF